MTTIQQPIAIIGSGCRFPGGSSSPSKLWELLHTPRDVLQDFTDERLNLSNFYNPNKGYHGATDVKNKSYLLSEDCRLFDAAFFNTNPLEAASMDPAQRILLETVYEAFEAAGYTMKQIQGSLTSVFVGLMSGDYWDITMRDTDTMPTYTAPGMSRSIMSNRISYVFDLRGPSMTIDTACSSSLVALHQAVQSLQSGESTTAVVAGANLLLDASTYIMETKLQMLSPDSRCRMWDKSADGYARGEGFAAILLKPLSAALADGDDIECVIRGTGVNSDGRTKGIAMPSAEAQATLIRETYKRAGLDPVADRCHYFECHGTGTQAGDPIEARAIANTFFPENQEHGDEKLYVGSVKTVIGHLEGCAGLAGVLKASLAMQNRTVPANMHFTTLNPAVEPFYKHLKILTSSIPWPEITTGPRRVSVNSFGFGGTNAHVILESYEVKKPETIRSLATERFCGPLVFSARTETSLHSSIRNFTDFVKSNPSVDLENLSWVLQEKRGTFPFKHCFSAPNREKLLDYMDEFIKKAGSGSLSSLVTRTPSRSSDETPRVLGIFTGQGAQWASMGKALLENCQLFRESIHRCEAALAELADPPPWSLKVELLANDGSRIREAALSQPLCTAVQIAMVDLATAAGLRFSVVVGHSSGEIAAAYAAGILSASDAMAIAYYRGFHAKLAEGKSGEKGGMMAVGISYATSLEICSQPQWMGRIGLAASNSPSSVTLSGDVEAIKEAKAIFDEHKTFARLLQVDTAYHSHHMLPCAGPYLKSLLACNIKINQPRPDCIWISSVIGDASLLDGNLETLTGQYWVDNMVKPVLFSQALEFSLSAGRSFEMAVEIGPHPALKGPALQVFKSVLGSAPPYTGFMRRGADEVEAFSGGLGFLWANLGHTSVNFVGYREAFQGPAAPKPKMLKGLPSYAWDHDKIYWKESRISRNHRLRPQRLHELLGRRASDDSDYEVRWRNFLRLNELPWLRGHEFQGQALFPATGHVAMALEASRKIAGDHAIRLFELRNISFHKALIVDGDQPGVEIVFSLRLLNDDQQAGRITKDVLQAEFTSYACSDETSGQLEKVACGSIVLHLGESTGEELPRIEPTAQSLTPVDIGRVYSALGNIGLNYHGPFRNLARAKRTRGHCQASAVWQNHEMAADEYIVHPVLLDNAFQAMYIALTSPATNGILWTTYLPSSIERLTVDPAAVHNYSSPHLKADMEAFVTESTSSFFVGDVNVFDPTETRYSVQVEGLLFKAIAEASPANDRLLFAKTIWDVDIICGASVTAENQNPEGELEQLHAIERVALFYLQDFVSSVSKDEVRELSWYHQRLFAAAEAALARVRRGNNPMVKPEWLGDTRKTIDALHMRFPDQVDLRMMQAISLKLLSSVRGSTPILEVMLQDDLLYRFYQECWGNRTLNGYVARVVQQITHKYPRAKLLEIGAGTGGTTSGILHAVGNAYASYTYTDISSGFFAKAAEKLSDHTEKMTFKVLDIEKDPAAQGFSEGAYDIVICVNVLHATRSLSNTLAHTRSLLRPGGYLVLMEITADALRNLYIFGTLPGWWLGAEEGRSYGPFVSDVQWDCLLRRSGFSGVDTVLRDCPDVLMHGASVMVSQAVDDTVRLLREPMTALSSLPEERLLIVGGKTLPVLKIVRAIQDLLVSWKPRTSVVNSIDALDMEDLSPGISVISLTELDRPLFSETMTDDRLKKLQGLFSHAKTILWVTTGCSEGRNPESNMTVGIGRALLTEMPNLTLQFLDVKKISHLRPTIVVEYFLRLALSGEPAVAKDDILWTVEPEVAIDAGALLLPRVVSDIAVNERFNAERRLVKKTVSTNDTCVEIATTNSDQSLSLREVATPGNLSTNVIDVQYSVAFSKDCNLIIGVLRGTSLSLLALSSTAASSISGLKMHISVPDGYPSPLQLISDVASHALALELVKLGPTDRSVLLVHEAPAQLVGALRYSAAAKGISVVFSSSKDTAPVDGHLHLHHLAAERTIRKRIPRTVGCFIDLSSCPSTMIPKCLPRGSAVYRFSNCAGIISSLAAVPVEEALANAINCPLGEPDESAVVGVQDLAKTSFLSSSYPNVVHWDRSELQVAVQPLDPTGLFRPDKTYFMVGMTGELGLSLAGWMIDNGARHIVLTSRSASVDASWLNEIAVLGAIVKVYQMDVSDKESVRSVYNTVIDTMPPIAGVCNAAMVLKDNLFVNMDVSSLNSVLLPKVEGTKILDELFNEPNLDFFILFSSLATVFGNAGQSNYHAANLFMNSVAAKRREQGLAASIMHIGMIADIGYVARAGRQIEDHLRKLLFHPMSEIDLHHLFAEAVMNSRPECEGSWDIVSGIDPFVDTPDAKSRPQFYSNPRFSHFIHEDVASKQPSASTASDTKDIKQTLDGITVEEDARKAIEEAFLATLELMLQMAPNTADANASMLALGMDSLVAVEIRTWFLKRIGVDIPVFKLLSGDTVADLCKDAAGKFMATKTGAH